FVVTRYITRDLATAGRVTNVDGVLQVQGVGDRGSVLRIGVHVMAQRGLGRATVTSAIVRDYAVSVLEEKQHLGVPIIGRQRPSVMKHDGLPRAPILVVNLCSVFGRYKRHGLGSCRLLG